ncbi:MAG TPA: hybrid sensor histidine kinase/response regulator [Isosphaeraceae bacterium]|jgi:signal transduction histidine kinase|nr:hybrid sensor histidine kinase/response regulator [Isosphaeraceae bacterium]
MDQSRHTLLIVDDEVDVLESLRHLFHRHYRVLTATMAAEALDLLAQNDVHLILSDQRMPGMTGDVFLGQARRLYPDAIRMMFTGYADIQAVINAVNEGHIFRYVVKPWDTAELEGIIRQAAERFEILAERKRLITELQQANTQLTHANQELAETSQLKSAFIEVASHEFNTPITIVYGMSELLKLLDPERNEQEREIIDRLATGAGQLARLVGTILKLMKSDDFRRTLQRVPTDLAKLLGEVTDQVRPFIRARWLHLHVDVADDLGIFEIDADKIRDAVTNLLINAIKFTPDGGEITLTARLSGPDDAEITVADRGIGIEPRALAQIFEPFFTEFDPSCHSSGDFGFKKRGLGLGLSIVKKFVELHGGCVSATSVVGEGTSFTISLPRKACPPETSGVE